MRRSRNREVILEELRKLKTHPRGDELYEIVRRRLPRVSLGTVYRNLDLLRGQGQLAELHCGDFNRYDGNVSTHGHFLCQGCRRLWDFEAEVHPTPTGPHRTREGFQVEGSYTVYYGLCGECQPGELRG